MTSTQLGVVTRQPDFSDLGGGFQAMAFPGQMQGVPAGLEYLSAVDQLIIKQEVSVFEPQQQRATTRRTRSYQPPPATETENDSRPDGQTRADLTGQAEQPLASTPRLPVNGDSPPQVDVTPVQQRLLDIANGTTNNSFNDTVVTDLEAKNKYRILNSLNQQAYWAFEESQFCNRICCGPDRGFIFHITDNNQQDVMTVTRDFRCCSGCPWCADGCCYYPIEVKDRFGHKLGMTRQFSYWCTPHMGIFDENDELVYEISGPCCPCQTPCCKDDVNYPIIHTQSKQQVGVIKKIWTDVLRETCTDVNTFSLSFPLDLDVKHKALMLGAVFLVDFVEFEYHKG